ncbi:MAG: hypothetical protein RIB30_21190 [Thalassospira sp.]|uniref:substrate-binding periplasmic protein n=1 Tax=Thalassospira sp. TaxID=1912094 RepID=UPI0032EFE88C
MTRAVQRAGYRVGTFVFVALMYAHAAFSGVAVAYAGSYVVQSDGLNTTTQQAQISHRVANEDKIRFAVAEWPPMVTETMANFGKHAHRVTEIFAAMGYRVQFDFLSWQRSYELTKRGEYVGTFPWLSTPERARDFLVPRYPVAQAYQRGFYRKSRFPGGLDVTRFEDLRTLGLRPVGIASYWQENEFIKLGIEAEIVANPESAWRFLDAGRADILFEEEEVGWLDLMRNLGPDATQAYAITEPITTDSMFILISRNHPDGPRLQAEFEAFMDTPRGQLMCVRWDICETHIAEHN